MAVLIGIAAGMAFAAFLAVFLAWSSLGNQICTLSNRVKDYVLVTPMSPGVKGAVTTQLFEAMKEVCETAKAHADAEHRLNGVRKNGTALVSDEEMIREEWLKAGRVFAASVDRLKKIEGVHPSGQK